MTNHVINDKSFAIHVIHEGKKDFDIMQCHNKKYYA
jgi:hypothetical protein